MHSMTQHADRATMAWQVVLEAIVIERVRRVLAVLLLLFIRLGIQRSTRIRTAESEP